jgi:alpha-tubulin suppressor-like RCC1 family protein
VTLAGRPFCWGFNSEGQLGDGTTSDRSRPVSVDGGLTLAQVRGGALHSCGVATGGRAFCWGDNDWGQLGDGTTVRRLEPVPVAGPM